MKEVLLELGYNEETETRYIKAYKKCVILIDIEKGLIYVYSTEYGNGINKFSTKHDGDIFKDILNAKIRDFLEEGETI